VAQLATSLATAPPLPIRDRAAFSFLARFPPRRPHSGVPLMRRWHAETNPQHAVLPGSAGCVVMTGPGFSEDQLSKPVPGRRF